MFLVIKYFMQVAIVINGWFFREQHFSIDLRKEARFSPSRSQWVTNAGSFLYSGTLTVFEKVKGSVITVEAEICDLSGYKDRMFASIISLGHQVSLISHDPPDCIIGPTQCSCLSRTGIGQNTKRRNMCIIQGRNSGGSVSSALSRVISPLHSISGYPL